MVWNAQLKHQKKDNVDFLLNSVIVINACLLFPPLLSPPQSFFHFNLYWVCVSLLSATWALHLPSLFCQKPTLKFYIVHGDSSISKYHDSLFSTEIIMCDITSRDMTKHHPVILNLHLYIIRYITPFFLLQLAVAVVECRWVRNFLG